MLSSDEEEILDRLLGGVVAVDADGRVVHFNGDAWSMLGWDPRAILGEPVTRIVPAELASDRAFVETVCQHRTRLLGRRLRLHLRDCDGKQTPVDAHLRLFRRRDGTDLLVMTLHPPEGGQIPLLQISSDDRMVLPGA